MDVLITNRIACRPQTLGHIRTRLTYSIADRSLKFLLATFIVVSLGAMSKACAESWPSISISGDGTPRKASTCWSAQYRTLPAEIPITLSIHGIGENAAQRKCAAMVSRLAGDDPRIRFEPPVPRPQVMATLLAADALAVPSLWLEMAPMVVLEAKAAGLPIIGSRLGGIAELVNEPEDGMLVPPGNVAALAEAIMAMFTGRTRRPRSRPKAEVRTMRDVARDMASLYESLGR